MTLRMTMPSSRRTRVAEYVRDGRILHVDRCHYEGDDPLWEVWELVPVGAAVQAVSRTESFDAPYTHEPSEEEAWWAADEARKNSVI